MYRPLSFLPRRELAKGAHNRTSVALEHEHYISVHQNCLDDPPDDPSTELRTPDTSFLVTLVPLSPPQSFPSVALLQIIYLQI
jgi:hypothetical protein